jgi:competence protein ComEA
MLRKFMLAFAMSAIVGLACAAVDVNQADQAALDGIRGIGPTMSKAILAERKQHGEFKDWADLQARVKGIGDKNSQKFSEAGLTVNGVSKAAPKPDDKKGATPARH